jgi:hypothetical protein
LVGAAVIEPSKIKAQLRVTAKVTVAAVNGCPIVEIGNHYDIGLVIARAGLEPCFPFAHVIGCS